MKKYSLLIVLTLILYGGTVCTAAQNPRVILETNFGDIILELYPEAAPITVDNFLSYVNSGFYDGILFHRSESRGRQTSDGTYIYTGSLDVIQAGLVYMIDGGFYGRQEGDPIINESYNGLNNVRGTIAMARQGEDEEGNPQPDSATAQFFINHQDNTELDKANYYDGYGYCVFGAIVEGLDVMDSIAQADLGIFTGLTNFFPRNPYVIINLAYELPGELSYCSDFVSSGEINFEDFEVLSSHWLDDTCDSVNGFCNGADLDFSGGVDIVDLNLFWNHWISTAGYESRFSDLFYTNTIDMNDLIVFTLHWLDTGCNADDNYCDGADINRDGTVNLTDYRLFSNNWLISL